MASAGALLAGRLDRFPQLGLARRLLDRHPCRSWAGLGRSRGSGRGLTKPLALRGITSIAIFSIRDWALLLALAESVARRRGPAPGEAIRNGGPGGLGPGFWR